MMSVAPYFLFEKAKRQFQQFKPSENVFGPSTEIFVGKQGYPNVYAGPLVGVNNSVANPRELFGKNYDEILAAQMALIRGKQKFDVTERVKRDMQEVSMSIRPVDVEMQLSKAPTLNLELDQINRPMGASGFLKKFMQAENPRIPKKVDYVIRDDLKVTEAVDKLSDSGFDSYYITNIFATGAFGIDKRMVPTRWSITAIDDIIAKQRMEDIRDHAELNEFLIFESSFLDNHFHVLLIPGKWEFENFESWPESGQWAGTTEEYEGYYGRTKYADKQVGGYYASRFAVVEYLNSIRKQAKVVIFREIGEGYVAPVGVWQIRENVRNALTKKPAKFDSLTAAINYLSAKLNVKMTKYLAISMILSQRRLTEF